MNELLSNFLLLLVYAFDLAILGRVVMSWISPGGTDPLSQMLIQITEPVLGPLRRVIPPMGMFDLSPMIALLLINFVVLPVISSVI